MLSAEEVGKMSLAELRALARAGHPVPAGALDDAAFRGVSLGLPAVFDRVAWKTFQKVFHRGEGGVLRGWNVRVEQRGVRAPSEARMRGGRPWTFGHFAVVPAGETPGGVLLDYGRGGNAPWDPVGLLRDPLVALEPGRGDLLLGWSYLDVLGRAVQTPSFFTLEYEGPLGAHRPAPPWLRRRA